VKARLHSRINCDFLADNLIVYIEKEIAMNFIVDVIIDVFFSLKDHQ
jgi:hypothetical protein